MPLRLNIRHLQYYDKDGNPYIYTGANPASLSQTPGTVPQTTWLEITEMQDGLQGFKLSWKEKKEAGEGGSNIDYGVSGDLTLYDKAYQFVKYWLNDHVAAPLNAVEVQIVDIGCVTYDSFVIKSDGLRFCNDSSCHIEVTLKQVDAQYDCIRKTTIADNWQGWFHRATTKQHPLFPYCDEFRPAGVLTAIFVLIGYMGITLYILATVLLPMCLILKGIGGIFSSKLRHLPCGYGALSSAIADLFAEIAGCGRAHPAPLVRDYISNVCLKCGVSVNAATAPVFFDPASPYYNLTYLNAEVKKGVRPAENIFWIEENEPLLTLDMFLDKLKGQFNAKWSLSDGKLYFLRRDKFISPDVVFDFAGADQKELISTICTEWNGEKKPAFMQGIYQKDPIDTVANSAAPVMNDIVEFNNPNNPMLEGRKTVLNEFGMQRYMFDGIDTNYLHDAMKPASLILQLTGIIGLIAFNQGKQVVPGLKGYLIMKGDTAAYPKLIVWDGVNPRKAIAVSQFEYNSVMPAANTFYNTLPYSQVHPEDYDDFYNMRGRLYNYPMYFDAMFKGNLYENFWQIDDPRLNPLLNKDWELQIRNCCENLKRLGLDNGAKNIKIGHQVRLYASGYYTDGPIEEIEVSYDTDDKNGKYIKLKGKL